MPEKVFISYSRKDSKTMGQIEHALQQAGLDPWTDEGIPTDSPDWSREIESSIENCRAVVVILSPNAKDSHWVREELGYARQHGKPIFSLLVKGNERSAVPFGFAMAQRFDLRRNKSEGLVQLLTAFEARGWIKKTATSAEPAAPPSQSKRQTTTAPSASQKTRALAQWWQSLKTAKFSRQDYASWVIFITLVGAGGVYIDANYIYGGFFTGVVYAGLLVFGQWLFLSRRNHLWSWRWAAVNGLVPILVSWGSQAFDSSDNFLFFAATIGFTGLLQRIALQNYSEKWLAWFIAVISGTVIGYGLGYFIFNTVGSENREWDQVLAGAAVALVFSLFTGWVIARIEPEIADKQTVISK